MLEWFQNALQPSGMKDFCKTGYVTVNHMMLNAFVEKWYIETILFRLTLGEMSITLDDVACMLHLPIRGKLLDHGRIKIDKAF